MMRLAAFLLVCVLLTTSVISGTYAKYVSTATATERIDCNIVNIYVRGPLKRYCPTHSFGKLNTRYFKIISLGKGNHHGAPAPFVFVTVALKNG